MNKNIEDSTIRAAKQNISNENIQLADLENAAKTLGEVEVFVISRIIKVEVGVISRSPRLRLITLTAGP